MGLNENMQIHEKEISSSPMAVADYEDYYLLSVQEDVTPKRVIEIVEMLRKGEAPPVSSELIEINDQIQLVHVDLVIIFGDLNHLAGRHTKSRPEKLWPSWREHHSVRGTKAATMQRSRRMLISLFFCTNNRDGSSINEAGCCLHV